MKHRVSSPNMLEQLIIDSKLLIHHDFAATHQSWVAGSTLFQMCFTHATQDNPEGVVVYWNNRMCIRADDIRRYRLDRSKFGRLTRAGYNTLTIQVIHVSSHFAATNRQVCRKALRVLYASGATYGGTIICGDFNGAAYRTSTGQQTNLRAKVLPPPFQVHGARRP